MTEREGGDDDKIRRSEFKPIVTPCNDTGPPSALVMDPVSLHGMTT